MHHYAMHVHTLFYRYACIGHVFKHYKYFRNLTYIYIYIKFVFDFYF